MILFHFLKRSKENKTFRHPFLFYYALMSACMRKRESAVVC
jgi:hypothetical protein